MGDFWNRCMGEIICKPQRFKNLATDFTDFTVDYLWEFVKSVAGFYLRLDLKQRASTRSLHFGEEGFPGVGR